MKLKLKPIIKTKEGKKKLVLQGSQASFRSISSVDRRSQSK
jgi:hypothetical protein